MSKDDHKFLEMADRRKKKLVSGRYSIALPPKEERREECPTIA